MINYIPPAFPILRNVLFMRYVAITHQLIFHWIISGNGFRMKSIRCNIYWHLTKISRILLFPSVCERPHLHVILQPSQLITFWMFHILSGLLLNIVLATPQTERLLVWQLTFYETKVKQAMSWMKRPSVWPCIHGHVLRPYASSNVAKTLKAQHRHPILVLHGRDIPTRHSYCVYKLLHWVM